MTTDLSALLSEGLILDVQSSDSRKQILCDMANTMGAALDIDGREIFDAVMERENLGSTGVGEGVAIPHARIDGLEKAVGAFVRLTDGVDFDAIDAKPCDLIFMLLAPHGSGADHLRALAQVSRAFRHADLRDRLRVADNSSAIMAILCEKSLSQSAA